MKTEIVYYLIVVMIMAAFLGCTHTTGTRPDLEKPSPVSTLEAKFDPAAIALHYPKVDGSTSTHPLHISLACSILNVPCVWKQEWHSARVKTRRLTPGPVTEKKAVDSVKLINALRHNGTHESYVNLIRGYVDLVLVARAPSADELKEAAEAGVALDVKPVALDAFVFLLNEKNPVNDLSLEAVRDIYAGKIKTWTALGVPALPPGMKDPIRAYSREKNSGSQELMMDLVMKDLPMTTLPSMTLHSMMGPINALTADISGIGYSVYFYAVFMTPEKSVKVIGINGIRPDADNIAKRRYPLTAEVYAVVRKGLPQNSTALMLRDWLFTKEGKEAIARSGYIPVN